MDVITQIANKLPDDYYVVYHKAEITGEDIHLSGLPTDGIKNDQTVYLINMPVYREVNHKKRLRRALKTGGVEAVRAYAEKYLGKL